MNFRTKMTLILYCMWSSETLSPAKSMRYIHFLSIFPLNKGCLLNNGLKIFHCELYLIFLWVSVCFSLLFMFIHWHLKPEKATGLTSQWCFAEELRVCMRNTEQSENDWGCCSFSTRTRGFALATYYERWLIRSPKYQLWTWVLVYSARWY